MKTLAGKLSDSLVGRLVPKTTATACMGPTATWLEDCFCGGQTCQWRARLCTNCGGITSCEAGCYHLNGPCPC